MQEISQILEKFNSLKEGPEKVIFGYRYIRQKVEDFVSISNLRLEILQVKDGKVMLSSAVPVLDINYGKGSIAFCDKDVCFITSGPKANIILRNKHLKPDEEASPVSYCYNMLLNENSQISYLKKAVTMANAPAYPGLDMREPEVYRCSKNPERFRLNWTKGLSEALGIGNNKVKDNETLKKLFLEKLDSLAIKTEEGYVVPFNWIYAGGMIIADAKNMGKYQPSVYYKRSVDFLRNWAAARNWSITTL